MSSEREQALARGIDLVRRELEGARSLPMADDEDDARAWAAVLAAVEERDRLRSVMERLLRALREMGAPIELTMSTTTERRTAAEGR